MDIEDLSPREVYKLIKIEGYTIEELANKCNCKQFYVIKKMIQFRRTVKKKLEERDCEGCIWGNNVFCPFQRCIQERGWSHGKEKE